MYASPRLLAGAGHLSRLGEWLEDAPEFVAAARRAADALCRLPNASGDAVG